MRTNLILLALLGSPAWAATNIAFSDPNVLAIGWSSSGTARYPVAQDGALYFTFSGTQLQATFYGTQPFRFAIDGGTAIAVSPLSSVTPTLTTVITGLTSGSHTVYAWGSSSDTELAAATAFTTDGTGSVVNPTFGTLYQVTSAPFSTYGRITDCPYTTGPGGYPDWPLSYDSAMGNSSTELGARYYATGSTQSVYVYAPGGTSWALYQDGVAAGVASPDAAGGAYQLLQVTGLDAGQHLYEWVAYGILSGANGLIYVMPSGLLSSVSVPARLCVGIYGDSIAALAQFGSGTPDSRLAWWAATHATGFDLMRMGKGGQKVVTFLETNTAAITGAVPTVPTIVIHEGGVNDQQAWTGTAPNDAATFQAAVLAELSNMAAGLPTGVRMLWEQILPNTAAQSQERGNYNAAIIAAIAVYNAGAPTAQACTYNSDNWINPAMDTVGDGLHPELQNAPSAGYPFGNPLQGYGKISNRLSLILAGYGASGSSLTVSGPASGAIHAASTSFTVSAGVSGAQFSGENIAIGDGGKAGWFVASTGDSGTGSMTVATAVGSSSFTFTYTPASIGIAQISYNGLPDCWTAPASMPYTARSPIATGFLIGAKVAPQKLPQPVEETARAGN